MFRELHEEVGLLPDHVRIVARTRDWLRYECLTTSFVATRGTLSGSKQIWFLLQLIGRDSDMNLRATDHPDSTPGAGTNTGYRWNWSSSSSAMSIRMALTELARFCRAAIITIAICVLACGRTIAKKAWTIPPA